MIRGAEEARERYHFGDEFVTRLKAFLDAPTGCAPVRIDGLERIRAGRSRENFVFDALWRVDGRVVREPLIVRRDPRGGLLETDRTIEFVVLRALEGTDVPAPRARWLDATGAAFERYVRTTGFEVEEASVAWWSVFATTRRG